MSSLWIQLRRDFANVGRSVYLDHAAGGPVPRPVLAELERYQRELAREADFAWPRWIRRREEVRRDVARFIGASPEEVTFTHSTSEGMNYIAELLVNQGRVLTNADEFPSSTLPWIWRKAKMTYQKSEDNVISLRKLSSLIAPSTKTIVSSFVQYATGFRQDMVKLGKVKRGRFLVVNATQGCGAFPINVKKWNADFLCTNSYKWMLAGYGGGILYIRKKWLARFRPSFISWRSMKEPDRMDNRRIDMLKTAARYEWGCPSFASIFAVGAAVRYFSSIGIEKIEKRILALTDFAIEELERSSFEVTSPRAPEHRSGIVVFKVKEAGRLFKRLLGDKIYVSPRGEGMRIAPHFYNTFEEIEILIKSLKKYRK
ncbi:MAG: aminotransferase class V-fold PLP-dependent enzyme [Candidatus Omnitrophota bacterium]|nr:aminotransferase class V-fold PLP-dependent enzyme [Candidatus Omnitrophota bacterium]